MTFHAQLADSAREAARVAAGVAPGQLAGRTPCADFDTRALANHLVAYTGVGLETHALRKPYPEDLETRDFTAAPDWARAYAERLDRAVAAWADPAVWDGEIGTVPAADMVAMLFMELCLHAWDLARATGQDYAVADATAERLLVTVRQYAAVYAEHNVFAEPVEVSEGVGAVETAVALSGRDPYWRA